MVSTVNIHLDQVTIKNGRQINVTHTDIQRETTNDLNYNGRYMLTLLPFGGLEHFGPWFAFYEMHVSTQTTRRPILENSNCPMFFHSFMSFITLSSTSRSSYQYRQRYVKPIVSRVFTFLIASFCNLFQISHFWNCRVCEKKEFLHQYQLSKSTLIRGMYLILKFCTCTRLCRQQVSNI